MENIRHEIADEWNTEQSQDERQIDRYPTEPRGRSQMNMPAVIGPGDRSPFSRFTPHERSNQQ